jgi:hypothetical protein
MMKKVWLCKVSGSAFTANICEYFELNNSHLKISPIEHLYLYKGMQFIENWFDPGFAVWW